MRTHKATISVIVGILSSLAILGSVAVKGGRDSHRLDTAETRLDSHASHISTIVDNITRIKEDLAYIKGGIDRIEGRSNGK